MPGVDPITSLYAHVPFCAHKCVYCAFYSEASQGDLINRYVDAFIRELEIIAEDLRPRTIFFGGGTPSILNLRQWETVLRAMERLHLLGATEWTIESNPATVSLEKAKLWREFGVNRVSMGVQSLDEGLLDRLGRIHSRDQVFKSFDILRRAGFDNINVDLMFAIPGQTMALWRDTLREAIALGSEHLSCYEVIYEDDTPLYAQLQAGEFDVDEDLACAMYEELVETAALNGFVRYEIANFGRHVPVAGAGKHTGRAQEGFDDLGYDHPSSLTLLPVEGRREPDARGLTLGVQVMQSFREDLSPNIPTLACQHNVNYWRGGSFHGVGPSATGYVRGLRTKNWANTQLYCEQLEKGRRAIESSEKLSPEARAGETAAFGLRMPIGWRFDEFRRITGFDLRTDWPDEMSQLVSDGLAVRDAEGIRLTDRGLRFADLAAEAFIRIAIKPKAALPI